MKIEIKRMHRFAEGSTKAAASVTIGGMITIHDCRIIEKSDGTMFVGMPSKKDKNQEGKWWPLVKIENEGVYNEFQAAVVGAYLDGAGA